MSYKRPTMLASAPNHAELTRDLIGIGLQLSGEGNPAAFIEETLVYGVAEAFDAQDFRLLSLIVTWLGVHSDYLHADRLIRSVNEHPSSRVRAFWRGFAEWKSKDRRFRALRKCYDGPRVGVLPVGTAFQIQRHGEDPRFQSTVLRVPSNLLRDRPADVLTPQELSRQHPGYRARVMFGPSWRADVWAILEANPSLSVAQVAHKAKASYATAWETQRDFDIAHAAQ